jgi:hypothetical protein
VCKRCGKALPSKDTRNYCSWACRYPDTTRPCEVCGAAFRPTPGSVGRFCSYACYGDSRRKAFHVSSAKRIKAWMWRYRVSSRAFYISLNGAPRTRLVLPHAIECPDCHSIFIGKWVRYCAECSIRRGREHKRRAKARRRAAKRGATESERYIATEIYQRDGYRCHLCKRKVRRNVVVPHDLAATIDHLIPISDGGTDTRRNVATAHFRCNWERNTGGMVQLRIA